MFSIYSNYHTLCYTFMWFFKTRQSLTNSFVFRDDLTMMSIFTKKGLKISVWSGICGGKRKICLVSKNLYRSVLCRGRGRTDVEWWRERGVQNALRESSHRIFKPLSLSLLWFHWNDYVRLCTELSGLILLYSLACIGSVEYFKYYLCTKCTYSWSITTWWEFWIVSWEEGEEEKLFYQRSIGHWSSPLLLSVWEMGVAFSTIFFLVMHIQSFTGSHLISYLMLGIPNCELERRKGRGNDSCGKCSHRFSSFPLWAKFSFLLPLKPVGATGSFVPGPSSSAFALQWLFGRKISDILHDNEGLGRAGRKMLGKVQISRLHEKTNICICI